ncbi:DUF423 domain-containing protein [Acidisphaera sp. L21]|uniref:DUF423 domain-containing protein n=1 Tax=Acidisphaera sp. L21 TaxID=1641851 RepID=UPI0015751EF2|nr:DUF423 domain-containing protein [Acidisphaera sp. L21]
MYRLWIGLAGLFGAAAVGMAAAAAHALAGLSPMALHVVESGIQMQGWHALALLGCGIWSRARGGLAHWAGAAFALGTLLFCAAVYSFGLAGVSLAAVAPTGGILLMLGWLLLAASAIRRDR